MNEQVSVYILAGGQSKRMGEDKGLILLKGKPVTSYILDEAKKISSAVTIVTSNINYKQFGVKIIPDILTEYGPAAGIDTALQDAGSELIFITSCDMPFIDEVSISKLISCSNGHEITLTKHDNFLEPMFAVYKKECLKKWHQALLDNTRKLSDIISRFDTNFVPAELFLNTNPHIFLNINTPEDLLLAEKWMKK